MLKDEILDKLIEKTAQALNVDKSTLNENTEIQSMGLKSLEMAAIISSFEEEYDCYIKYTELMHAVTIGDAAEAISKMI